MVAESRAAGGIGFWKAILLVLVVPVVLVVVLVNWLWGGRIEPDPRRRIANALGCRNYAAAAGEYRALVQANPNDVKLHRGYLVAYFAQPKHVGRDQTRDDTGILGYYDALTRSTDPVLADLGNYGLGLAWSLQDDHRRAVDYFARVRNQSMAFLNNSFGYSLDRLGRTAEAERRYEAELALGGNTAGAASNLASLLLTARRVGELRALAMRPGVTGTLPYRIERFLAIEDLRLGAYVWSMLKAHVVGFQGFAGAALLLGVWFVFVRRIDVFEPEPLVPVLGCLLGGMLSTLPARVLYDVLDFGLGFQANGNPLTDLAFSVLGIGLVEELVKILPVLMVIGFTREVDESVDYFVYASLSGLGFAFVENLSYFDGWGPSLIVGRGLVSVPLHMAMTSLAVYGLFYARYRRKRYPVLWFVASFSAACAIHGLFDFFLITKGLLHEMAGLSIVVFLWTLIAYRNAIHCGLNLSEHGDRRRLNLTAGLSAGIGLTFVVQYLTIAYQFGVANANRDVGVKGFALAWIVVMTVALLGTFVVEKGRWIRLRPQKDMKAEPPQTPEPAPESGGGGTDTPARVS